MVITLADAGGRKSFEPPASSDTGRTLTYRGRWNEADRTVEMDPDTCAYRVVESVGGDPFSQPLDRDAAAVEATVRWLQEHPDVRTWKAFRETPKADRPAGLPGKGDRMSSIYNRARQALDQGCSPCSPDLGNSGEQGNAGRR